MRILLVTPSVGSVHTGNLTTSQRWLRLFGELGHEATLAPHGCDADAPLETVLQDADPDVLVTLHARKCSAPVLRFRALYRDRAIVVALTGTDLYRDLSRQDEAMRALDAADRVVVLHDRAHEAVPEEFHDRLVVIHQSVEPGGGPEEPEGAWAGRGGEFRVVVLAHLRDVKDPLMTARAARGLPERSRIRVLHAGAALSDDWASRARREARENPRYDWLGELPHSRIARLLAGSHLLSLTSRLEGGANVVSEAVVAGTPVVSTRIAGSVGLLGESYPGYFPVGDAEALASCLLRAEEDSAFYRALGDGCRRVRPLFRPEVERDRWRALLDSLPLRG